MSRITDYAALTAAAAADLVPVVDVSDTSMAATGTTKKIALSDLASAITPGFKFLTAWPATPGTVAGTITASTITSAQAAGWQGIFLDPRYVWDASGLSLLGISNFTIESRMAGSIGWAGAVTYNTGGYVKTDTGTPADGIQVYGNTGQETQGVTLRGLVIVGSNTNAVVHQGGRQRSVKMIDCLVYNTNSTSTTVAAGSNGTNVTTFAGTQTLNVASTTGFATTGNVLVITSASIALVSYNGKTSGTLANCTLIAGDSGTLATGGSVWQAAFGVVSDAGILNFNSEDQQFRGVQVAGQNCCVGIGINDLGQHSNDTTWYDLTVSCLSGPAAMINTGGSNHNFHNYYDRSTPGASVASVWSPGGTAYYWGGEELNNSSTGVAHLVTGGTVGLVNRTITIGGRPDTRTVTVTGGSFMLRGRVRASGVFASSGGNIDLSDPAGSFGGLAIDGSGGSSGATVMIAGDYNPGSGPSYTSWAGTTLLQGPFVANSNRGTGRTTAVTVSWTPPAQSCRFRASINIFPTVAGTSTVPVLSFTRPGGVAISQTIPMWKLDSAATAPSYTCNATGFYTGTLMGDTDGSGTAVSVTITPTGSTYGFSVSIERIS